MELIDSHAHIDFPQFAEDREAMLDRARAAGVTALLAIGTGPGPEKLDSAMPFAEQHDWIYATVGIHPHEAKEVTPGKMLIETDAPYLAPQHYRGKRNERAYVAEVARTLATVRNLSPDEVAAATSENFRRFFGLVRPAPLAAPGFKDKG